MGATRTGVVPRENLIVSMIIGSIQGGVWPDGAIVVDIIPVDSLSRAMTHLIGSAESGDQTYHLTSRSTMNWHEGGLAIQAAGYPLEMVQSRSVFTPAPPGPRLHRDQSNPRTRRFNSSGNHARTHGHLSPIFCQPGLAGETDPTGCKSPS